jgi:hypothetical protein
VIIRYQKSKKKKSVLFPLVHSVQKLSARSRKLKIFNWRSLVGTGTVVSSRSHSDNLAMRTVVAVGTVRGSSPVLQSQPGPGQPHLLHVVVVVAGEEQPQIELRYVVENGQSQHHEGYTQEEITCNEFRQFIGVSSPTRASPVVTILYRGL